MSEKYAKKPAANTVPRPAPFTYWLTRNVDPARGVEFVAVWSVQPQRVPWETGGAYWIDPDARGPLCGYVASIWPAECWRMFGTEPEDSIECVRVERNKPLPFDERHAAAAP